MPTSGLFIETAGGLRALSEAKVELEDDLQALVAKYPALLSGDDDSAAGRRWLLIRREQGIALAEGESARFSLDHLFVDQDGVPTLVEVKRAADTRARREVVAQMLDYAANARFLQALELRAAFEASSSDHDAALRCALGEDVDPDELWRRAALNLEQGNLRLVFLADRIPKELRALVEFLNEQLRTMEVLAIEVSTFETGGTRVLRAKTIGQTEAARAVKGGRAPNKSWDRDTWLAHFEDQRGPAYRAVVERLLAFADQRGLEVRFGKRQNGSLRLGLERPDAYIFPFFLHPGGGVEVMFQNMVGAPYPPFDRLDKREALLTRLNSIGGIDLPVERIALRPNFSLSVLQDEGRFAEFIKIFEWILDEAEASGVGTANLGTYRTGEPPPP
jgi:hypothetical protein